MRMRMGFGLGVLGIVVAFLASAARAAPIINVGAHSLLPGTPGQTVQIFVSGSVAVEALNFLAQVADGGPAAGGSVVGPAITSADLLTGTIFSANNGGVSDLGSVPQSIALSVLTSSGTVSTNGLLATLTFDTTGFTSGTWSLSLANTVNGSTDFADVAATITDGTITIAVPEPGLPFAIGITGMVVILLRRVRGQRSRPG